MSAAEKTVVEAINEVLHEVMAADPKVIVLGEDVADSEGGGVVGVTRGLSQKFGDRVMSTPISEQAIVGAAIGAALAGYRPVAEIMLMNFSTVAMDMIVNHAAKIRYMSGGQSSVPIVIRMMAGAGNSAACQHSDFLEAWFAHTPGIKVVAPSCAADARGLMLSCIADPDPCIFIESIMSYGTKGPVDPQDLPIPLGTANVMRAGTDLTLISYAAMAQTALQATELLAKNGVSAEVIDLRTVAPWDRDTVINSVRKTGRALVVHEAVRNFGVGAEIAATINEELFGQLKAPVRRLGAPLAPVPFNKQLEEAYVVSANAIAASAYELVS